MGRTAPDLDKLNSQYDYNAATGDFLHLRNSARGRIGNVAGTLRPDGYIGIVFNGQSHLGHRLAWFISTNEWPKEIDHIDGNRANNRIINLRLATRAENNGNSRGWNQSRRRHKLPRGVYYYAQCPGRYRAQIVANRKQIHLGCFDTIEAAQKAYGTAARKHFGKFWSHEL